MTTYVDIIYPKDEANQYPARLAKYIFDRFFDAKAPNNKLLEIGCCQGRFLNHFADLGMNCHGTDIRDENIAHDFKACNLEKEDIPYPDNHFDFIYSKSVLEHVTNTDNFLRNMYRVLKPGGICVNLTPDWKSQHEFFWDDYTHVKPFTRKSLRDALLIHGYDQVNCEYFYQLPFVWKNPKLIFIPKIIAALVPDYFKWKTQEQRNTKDRKLIRFSKERMLLAVATKPR